MSHFDEQPDAPLHGECEAEIQRLNTVIKDMLDELQWFIDKTGDNSVNSMDTYEISEKFYEKAEKLIAKARGQQEGTGDE
jgi:hypothetical protein